MRKLLFVVGHKDVSAATLDFGCFVARLTHSPLTGAFVKKNLDDSGISGHSFRPGSRGHNAGAALVDADYELRVKQLNAFKEGCTARDTSTAANHRFVAWPDLLEEARFADLIILDTAFARDGNTSEGNPTEDAKRLLHEAGCPVIIAPLNFEKLDEIIMTYDGSKSSVHAIRQFCYLLPELQYLHVRVLEVMPEDGAPPGMHLLTQWLKERFRKVSQERLYGDVQSALVEYLFLHPNSICVMGGFGRSRFSRLLQKSTSGEVARFISSALFIAHC